MKIKVLVSKFNLIVTCLIVALFGQLSGCASQKHQPKHSDANHQQWVQSIVNYKHNTEHSVDTQALIAAAPISDEMRSIVLNKFSHLNKRDAAQSLALWLMSEDGHNMQYDLHADLFPIDAFEQKRGNCLSFTILLVNLADVLGIKLQYNNVHIPNTWGLGSEQQEFVLFRHINAVKHSNKETKIYDLAIEQYDYGFPQKIISETEAIASLHSNISTQKFQAKDYKSAKHHISYAISLYPKNPDFWVNLGVVYKKSGQIINAERSFLHALSINDTDSLAASNLENLYRAQEQFSKAEYYAKLAAKARLKNPYVHYQLATNHLKNKRFNLARKSISKAKKLHNQDPRFFILSSIIEQHRKNFAAAINDMQTAYSLTANDQDREYFSKKVRLLAAKTNNQ